MNFPFFLAKRITLTGNRTFSKLIVRVTIAALTLAILAIIMAVAILRGFKGEITDKQRGFFGDVIILKNDRNDSYVNTPISLSKDQINSLEKDSNVINVYPFATKAGIMNVKGEVEGVLLKGIDKDYDQEFLSKTILEGETIDFSAENAENQLLISSLIANRLNLKVGDSFIMYFIQEPVRKRKFTIRGIYTTNSEELDKVYVIGSLSLIRKLNNLADNEVGGYEVRVRDFNLLAKTTQDVNDQLPIELYATNVVEQMPDIFNWLNMLDMNDNIIFVLMVVVAVINMISALLISILERSSMIGILKSLGMQNSKIRVVFLYNSLYLIGYGLLLGNFLALLLYYFQRSTHFFKLDPSVYYVSFVPMDISWLTVVWLNIALIGIALITLFIPSMLISRISPIKTIQFK
ncbi:FtsX-like permease family protein [Sphingobacterium sp. DK4209]|uniref:FtsX-like permease family protein n=1 Tax=Sphingobacterium zhuxiongii TaxID=2662364 RepID=A0A5Q0QAE5_9SPHI|nr:MULTISPECIES: FtsX-like permease family protein [unclassified Sphingobacterium]MVZ66112.1 FtsX-like permease family protein [Sphingobacterium sp. DK4209]QGA26533.1 FtsX-like permease family protein [Sphingobacterium sp. dk4302]